MTRIVVVRCGSTILEQRHPRFEGSELLCIDILVRDLSLRPTGIRTFAGTRSFGLGSLRWSDDEVVKFCQDVHRKKVDLEFNLLGALRIKKEARVSVIAVGVRKKGGGTHLESRGHLRE